MQSQQKNKMIERFRAQKNPATERHFSEKEEKEVSSSCIDMNFHVAQTNLNKTADRSSRISTYFEKHIEYLEKKLADAETETNKAKLYSEILETKLDEQYAENDTMLSKMAENQKSTKQLLFKYEMLVSDHQNLKLKHKMEKLHREINEQKETQSHMQLKNKHLKQGKYSTAFLPSPFDSPNRTQLKVQGNDLSLDNLSNPSFDKSLKSSPKQKNPINSNLMDEYQKLKHQKAKKQKQILQLKAQNSAIKTELDAKNKQYNKLLFDRSNKSMNLNNEIIKWKQKVQQQKQQNKMLFNKLKSTQTKMLQLSQMIKNNSHNENGEDRQYNQNNNIDLSTIKYQKDCQTEEIINPESKQTQKIQQYISKIASLKSELLERTQQYSKKEEQYRNKLGSELRKCTELMEQYRSRVETVTEDMSEQKQGKLTKSLFLEGLALNNQVELESTEKQLKHAQVQCLIIASDILQERQYILQKAKIFIDFNEQQKNIIERLTIQKNQLNEQISHEQNFKITLLQEERNNFSNIYSELRKKYEQLELDYQKETKILNEQLAQRQIQLNNFNLQLQTMNNQVPNLKQKIAQYELRLAQYQKSIEEYQLKMEILNQQIDALRQNP